MWDFRRLVELDLDARRQLVPTFHATVDPVEAAVDAFEQLAAPHHDSAKLTSSGGFPVVLDFTGHGGQDRPTGAYEVSTT